MDELRQEYRRRLPERIQAIEAASGVIGADRAASEAAIRRLAHNLKGSGATYGFPEISEAARAVEDASSPGLESALQRLLEVMRAVAAGADAHAHGILIVDDDPAITRLLEAALASPGRRVYVADSVAAAAEALARHAIDLLVLDLVLPDDDGRRLLGRLRRQPTTARLPIFVMSAQLGAQTQAECYALGADAFFEKPLDPHVLAAAVAARLERAAGGEARAAAAAEPAGPPPAGAEPRSLRHRVLLAEDDELIASVVSHRLGRAGFDVSHFVDGESALAVAPSTDWSAAILDVKMPVMDGFELLERLRALPNFREVPILILTSLGNEADLVRGFALGASDYVVKPFSPTEVVARVRRLVRA